MSRPRMPRTVNVLGIRYRIRRPRTLTMDHEHDGEVMHVDLQGLMEPSEQRISIIPGLGPDQEAITFLHESLHAMVAVGGLDAVLDDGEEEQIVKRLSPILLEYLRRNRSSLAYMLGRWWL